MFHVINRLRPLALALAALLAAGGLSLAPIVLEAPAFAQQGGGGRGGDGGGGGGGSGDGESVSRFGPAAQTPNGPCFGAQCPTVPPQRFVEAPVPLICGSRQVRVFEDADGMLRYSCDLQIRRR